MFDIRDIEIAHEIARAGGFRAAAAKLHLSQSALSMRITALEERLGIVIFDRRHRGVRPTPIGREFLDQSSRLVTLRDEILSRLSPASAFMGTIRIGVADTVVHTWLSDMLNRLKTMSGIRLELSVDTSPVMARKLVEDELDVAVMMRQVTPERALSSPIYACELAYFAAPDFALADGPVGLAELVQHPIVTFPKGTLPYAEFERLFSGASLPVPLLHGCASLSTILHLARDGFGIGLLPACMATEDVAAGRLRRIATVPQAAIAELAFALAYMPAQPRKVMNVIHEAATAAVSAYLRSM